MTHSYHLNYEIMIPIVIDPGKDVTVRCHDSLHKLQDCDPNSGPIRTAPEDSTIRKIKLLQ
jgi:hypothetical protein